MRGRRWVLRFVCAILLLSVLGGCNAASERQKLLYNDEAELIQGGDTYSYVNRNGTMSNEGSALSFSAFYGMETIWIIHASAKGKLTFHHRQEVDRGKFKVVAIGPDNEVTTLAEGDSEGKIELKVDQGTYRIKVVGHGAKGRMNTAIETESRIRVTAATR
ncbi:hypothetical protein [Paenibacillus macerans]|uniref:hypothetical protein n=1 Tax=Paenibacillus macerans TaxID=44252 RepID=UPI003D31CDA3